MRVFRDGQVLRGKVNGAACFRQCRETGAIEQPVFTSSMVYLLTTLKLKHLQLQGLIKLMPMLLRLLRPRQL